MDNEINTIKLTDDNDTSSWYVDAYGDIFRSKRAAEFFGIEKIIIAEGWYPGSMDEWKKSIINRIS